MNDSAKAADESANADDDGDQPTVVVGFSPDYREVFVDGAVQATTRDGIIRLDLSADRYRPGAPNHIDRMIVSRLIMSRSTMWQLHRALSDVMARTRRAGDRGAQGAAGGASADKSGDKAES